MVLTLHRLFDCNACELFVPFDAANIKALLPLFPTILTSAFALMRYSAAFLNPENERLRQIFSKKNLRFRQIVQYFPYLQ